MMAPRLQAVLLWLALTGLVGCAGMLPPKSTSTQAKEQGESVPAGQVESLDLKSEYGKLASAGGTVFAVDPAASKVRIYVFRGGPMAAKVGHNHVLSAPKFEGYVHLPTDSPVQSRFDVRVKLDDLVVDDPRQRAETGGNFSGERSDSDKTGTKKNMLGEKGLESAKYPSILLHSVLVSGDWPILVADVDVTLHGVKHQQTVMLRVEHTSTEIKVAGTLVLRQSDFGTKPFSILGGALTVQDPVAIEFELKGKPAVY